MRAFLRIAVLSFFLLAFPGVLRAGEIKGKVANVKGDVVQVATTSEYLPNPGDRVEIVAEIPGLDDVALVASGKVIEVKADVIVVKLDRTPGEVRKNQLARITSDKPRKRGEAAGVNDPRAANPKTGESIPPGGKGNKPTGAAQPEDVMRLIAEARKANNKEGEFGLMTAAARAYMKEVARLDEAGTQAVRILSAALDEKFGPDPDLLLLISEPVPPATQFVIQGKRFKGNDKFELNVVWKEHDGVGRVWDVEKTMTVVREDGVWRWLPERFLELTEPHRVLDLKNLKELVEIDLRLVKAVKNGQYKTRAQVMKVRADAFDKQLEELLKLDSPGSATGVPRP